MAHITYTVKYDSREAAEFFLKMKKYFSLMRAQALGYIGNEVKKILISKYLSGGELRYKGFVDKGGRRKAGYSIDKYARYVRISSYPLNLFERGRMLRSGQMEPGHYIITRKLKSDVESSIGTIAKNFDTRFLQKYVDENF